MASTWAENNSGQRAEAERLEFDRLAIDIMRAQLKARKAAGASAVDRAFHAKALLAVDQATVTFRSDLPKGLAGSPSPAPPTARSSAFRTPRIMPAPTIAPTCAGSRSGFSFPPTSSTICWRPITRSRTLATRASSSVSPWRRRAAGCRASSALSA